MIAKRMASIRPFYVMELLARARALEGSGRSIIHMEVGEPDFETPRPIIEAGKRALEEGFTHYTPAVGIRELREAIALDYKKRFGVEVNPDRVLITPGSSGALQLIMGTVINPGQAVMMADPGYPCNRNFVNLVSGIPVAVPVGPDTGYQLTAEIIEREWSENTRAVMVATPSNPTGTLLNRAQLEAIYQVVKARGGVLIVDEIYQGLVYGVEPFTALEITDDLFIINSFSKYYGMTGWRLGWMVAPERFINAADRLAQNIFLAASTPAQYAALAAFDAETQAIVEARREAFRERRDYLLPALNKLGFEFPIIPEGAFYLYANCHSITQDSFEFAHQLLETEGVAVTPGRDFGDNQPEQYIRFAYTTSLDKLAEGVARIGRFIGR
ncbi:pyridoxal phosphate-dependent aminotransferase [Sedimenticola selenatireducens]|uniref:Aminotransferase n=1 Tax=Sedimenticola selenatireducens TaxID=191960 RepID=A0A557RZJ7_9GAMM|nr:pyridoxal phosphate-dependent aminotransferase [Sedimenticola selenatireducens]TVO70549.1 pyridoxal phosphate-dependent aminotransferase [Sedimenticola selenatireducens]TVT63126.1 MAG: pyridoxal phosphate-dependent aminotransferase [Sedimenticola selenatireducens]